MRILWFTNIPLQPLLDHWKRNVTGTGFWMHALIDPLRQHPEINRMGVVYAGTDCRDEYIEINGVDYYTVGKSHIVQRTGLGTRYCENRYLQTFVDIIDRFRPDVIHIHGTEYFYGRLRIDNLTNVPTLVSIQGIMSECAKHAWGDRTRLEMLPLINAWEVMRLFPTFRIRSNFQNRAKREKKIIRSVDGVIGRTTWDKAYTWSVSPSTKYFHVDEIMRDEFYNFEWNLDSCRKHRIYTSGRLTLAKGMHIFIEAIAILRHGFPDLDVHIAGGGTPSSEHRYLIKQIQRLDLAEVVHFTGWLNGSQIVNELQDAHVYANSSFIENGCNALQEAMLMSVPCVAGFAGGMSTTLEHRKTGLLYPRGNAFMLAHRIKELFENDDLAISLGKSARKKAQERHAIPKVMHELMGAYRSVSQGGNG